MLFPPTSFWSFIPSFIQLSLPPPLRSDRSFFPSFSFLYPPPLRSDRSFLPSAFFTPHHFVLIVHSFLHSAFFTPPPTSFWSFIQLSHPLDSDLSFFPSFSFLPPPHFVLIVHSFLHSDFSFFPSFSFLFPPTSFWSFIQLSPPLDSDLSFFPSFSFLPTLVLIFHSFLHSAFIPI